ncbi:MAG: hypothetical protein CUN54_08665, partial [Phototrophicales bacterium]
DIRLMRWWFIASVVVFLLMLTNRSDPATILGRYSSRFALLLFIMMGFVIVTGVVAWLERDNRLPYIAIPLPESALFARLLVISSIVVTSGFWYLRPGSRNFANEIFHFYFLIVLIGLALWTVRRYRHDVIGISSTFIMTGSVLVVVLLVVQYHGRVPQLSPYDEPFQLNLVYNVYKTRTLFSNLNPTLSPARLLLASYSLVRPFAGLWLDVVGNGFIELRLFYLLLAWAGVPFIYRVAQMQYGRIAAIIAAGVALVLPLHHNYARPDAFVMTMLSVGLYLYFTNHEHASPRRYYLTGVVLALGMEGHPSYGIRFAAAFGVIYLWHYFQTVRSTRQWNNDRRIFYYTAGVLTYLLIYFVSRTLIITGGNLNINETIDSLREVYMVNTLGDEKPFSVIRRFEINIELYVQYFKYHPLEVFALVMVSSVAIIRRHKTDVILLALVSLAALYMLLTLAHTNSYIGNYYAIHTIPLLALLTGATLAWAADVLDTSEPSVSYVALLIVGAMLGVLVADTVDFADRRIDTNHTELIAIGDSVLSMLPDDVMVAGDAVYSLAAPGRTHYTAASTVAKLSVDEWRDGSPRLDEWSRFGIRAPQAIIFTAGHNFQPEIIEYIEANNLVPARCYTNNFYERLTILYLPEDFLAGDESINC